MTRTTTKMTVTTPQMTSRAASVLCSRYWPTRGPGPSYGPTDTSVSEKISLGGTLKFWTRLRYA
jgi:hypothetical protein